MHPLGPTMAKVTYHFWISNIAKNDIILGDLGIRVPAGAHMNLLDTKYYSYTPEELIKSAKSGSLHQYIKRNKMCIRRIPPTKETKLLQEDPRAWDPSIVISRPLRSAIEVEEPYYEELEISDETYASEASDFTDEEYFRRKQ